jgi:hypothetical protein
MSLRSKPLKSFVNSIYQLLLMLAARRASRARGLVREKLCRFAKNRSTAFSNQSKSMLLMPAARRASRARGLTPEKTVPLRSKLLYSFAYR